MGHLYRSLTLAEEFVQRGENVHFLINSHEASLQILKNKGYTYDIIDLVSKFSGWEIEAIQRLRPMVWINDRLDTTIAHVELLKASSLPVVTFDDRGGGATCSDINVAALVFDPEEVALLKGDQILTGLDYLVLNPNIACFRRVRKRIGSTLVTLGGSDTYGATIKVIRLLRDSPWQVTIVLGPAFLHHDALAKIIPAHFEIRQSVVSMAEEMARHDLAITGGGITPFEANAAGLPCIVVANETFEVPVGLALQRFGGCLFAGHHDKIETSIFQKKIDIMQMSTIAMATIGLDGVKRVANVVQKLVRP